MTDEYSTTEMPLLSEMGQGSSAFVPTVAPAALHPTDTPLPVSLPELSPGERETVFEVVVATMWSDGELVTAEVERGRAVAEHLGTQPRGGGAFAAIADGALPFDAVQFDTLGSFGRIVAYASAEWVAAANTEPAPRRTRFLEALATRLQLRDEVVGRIRALVATATEQYDGHHPSFVRLLDALRSAVDSGSLGRLG